MPAFLVQTLAQQTSTPLGNITPVRAGNLAVFAFVYDPPSTASSVISSLSDAQGNTYTLATAAVGTQTSSITGSVLQVFWAILNSTAIINPTVNWTSGASAKVLRYYLEFNGINSTSTQVGVVSGTSTTGPNGVSAPATTQFGDLVLAIYGQESNITTYTGSTDTTVGTWTPTTPLNFITTGGNSANNQSIGIQYKVATAAGTTTARVTATAAPTAGGYNIITFLSIPSFQASVSGSLLTSGSVNNFNLVNFLRQTSGSMSLSGSAANGSSPFFISASLGDLELDSPVPGQVFSPGILTYRILTTASMSLAGTGSVVPFFNYRAFSGSGSMSLSATAPRILAFSFGAGSGSLALAGLGAGLYLEPFYRSATGTLLLTPGSPGRILRYINQSSTGLLLTPFSTNRTNFFLVSSASMSLSGSTRPVLFVRSVSGNGVSGSGSMSIVGSNFNTLVTRYFAGWGRPL